MRSKSEEIRKRIAKRKQKRERNDKLASTPPRLGNVEEMYGLNGISSFEGGNGEEVHPLFQKEAFLFKILASVCLFLLTAILFRNHSTTFTPIRTAVEKTMSDDFQFATVSDWYEKKFGKPLALLPPFSVDKNKQGKQIVEQQYAVPAAGRILEKFEKNGQGVMIETGKGAPVSAMKEGIITFAGVKAGYGKTVIIQHSDKTDSWYGNLDEIKVKLYDFIGKGKEVGTVAGSAGLDKTKGEYYFAIKKGDNFIDPIQVIRFE
ncbi:MAG: M23 family metallopeptidase [Bacillota bacterium]|nr:M23 family metallopeptidase [Bacillota bacterium]MDP4170816.1 M23 family metallopeptidase [Bacillota bacterium]